MQQTEQRRIGFLPEDEIDDEGVNYQSGAECRKVDDWPTNQFGVDTSLITSGCLVRHLVNTNGQTLLSYVTEVYPESLLTTLAHNWYIGRPDAYPQIIEKSDVCQIRIPSETEKLRAEQVRVMRKCPGIITRLCLWWLFDDSYDYRNH